MATGTSTPLSTSANKFIPIWTTNNFVFRNYIGETNSHPLVILWLPIQDLTGPHILGCLLRFPQNLLRQRWFKWSIEVKLVLQIRFWIYYYQTTAPKSNQGIMTYLWRHLCTRQRIQPSKRFRWRGRWIWRCRYQWSLKDWHRFHFAQLITPWRQVQQISLKKPSCLLVVCFVVWNVVVLCGKWKNYYIENEMRWQRNVILIRCIPSAGVTSDRWVTLDTFSFCYFLSSARIKLCALISRTT